MTGLRTLRTLPFTFRSLSSINEGHVAIHRSPVFGSTQTRPSSPTQIRRYSPLDAEPSDNPELFDVLLTDVDHRVLHGGVSEKLGCDYLSRTTKILKPTPEINGILFGLHHRPFFSFVTTYEQFSYNLHFLFETGSPFTYLSYDACDLFFKGSPLPNNFSVKLNGLTVLVRPAPAASHFKDVNILGADFCALHNIQAIANYKSKKAKLVFLDHQ